MRVYKPEKVLRKFGDEEERVPYYFIFHHFDLDGYASAGIIMKYLMMRCHVDPEYIYTIPCNHNYRWRIDEYVKGDYDQVYILDYSFNNAEDIEAFKRAYKITEDITWIDHHATSTKLVSDYKECALAARNGWVEPSSVYCATLLTYLWTVCTEDPELDFEKIVTYVTDKVKDQQENNTQLYIPYYRISDMLFGAIPEWIKLVDIHDTHKTFDGDFTKAEYFNTGSRYYGWHSIFTEPDEDKRCNYYTFEDDDELYDQYDLLDTLSIMSAGMILYTSQEQDNANFLKSKGFKAIIEADGVEYRCLCMNKMSSSSVFEVNEDDTTGRDKFDAFIVYIFDGQLYRHTIYSFRKDVDEVDVSKIAEWFGNHYQTNGGGHKHAAGFSTPELIFKDIRPGIEYDYED